jgi:hypothetical protein
MLHNRFFLAAFFVLMVSLLRGQNKTISQKNTAERETRTFHKALLIPFEPKLYMSEIDRYINAETNLSAKEIRHRFRDGLNEQLQHAFKTAKYSAVDLIEDTVKYKKDLEQVYQYLTYDYVKVPDQKNYKAPRKEKEENKIDKGQIIVETGGENRFMDARISNPKILIGLQNKYKTDLFVFINQLDILATANKGPIDMGNNPNRRIVVHYTVFNSAGQEMNSGIAEKEFEPELNNPKKIIDRHFSVIAGEIVLRINKALVNTPK